MMKRFLLSLVSVVTVLSLIGPPVSAVTVDCSDEEAMAEMHQYFINNDVHLYDPCDDTCAVENSTITKLVGGDNREKIFNYLKAKGLSAEQAAGVTGNIQHESGFSPTRQETSQDFPEGGWGIVQWTFGRRTAVVDYLNSKVSDEMSQYYKDEFGGGVSESSGFVPGGMSVEANDAILLNELDYLYKESTERIVKPSAIDKIEGVTGGEIEWDALKKQTTIEDASDLWLYSFEIPANIDAAAPVRAASGQAVFDLYNSTAAGATDRCSAQVGEIRESVVTIAEREYAEWQKEQVNLVPPDEREDNYYQKYTYGVAGEWCAWFASWVYKEAGYPVNEDAEPFYSDVTDLMLLGQKGEKFEWHLNDGNYTPQPGDIAIYGNVGRQYHTNIVISAQSPSVVTTIGGNEGPESATPATRNIKKTENGTYWPSEAYGYVSPKG